MKKCEAEFFYSLFETDGIQLVGHASPMPEHGYENDIEYYESSTCKAEHRVWWEPVYREEFWFEELKPSAEEVGGD